MLFTLEKIMFFLQTCPCCIFQSENCCIRFIQNSTQIISQIIGIALALFCIYIYLFDGVLARFGLYLGLNGFDMLGVYMYEIFVISQGTALMHSISHFVPFYCGIKICCFQVWEFGRWDLEKKLHLYRINVGNNRQKKFAKEEDYLKECVLREKTIFPCLIYLVLFNEETYKLNEEANKINAQLKEVALTDPSNTA